MESCLNHGKWFNLKKFMLGSGHQVSRVSVHCWSNGNIMLFSLCGSEIILLSMPEGMEVRSWHKSCMFKGFLFPYVYINWEIKWGEKNPLK